MTYLVRYTSDSETHWELMTVQQFAQSIANPDRSEHRIWRLAAEPQLIKYQHVGKYREVWLFDRFDNFIESGTYCANAQTAI